ncbi:MAG TPA: hypothetical protein DCR40_09475 [Prolixibacteraceae bacterium]|nr:hypothetical protein [Prolixibacteraceae bacterium]
MANGSSANETFLQKLNQIIQTKMSDADFGVNELAREMGMSRSNLHRRISEITGKTVVSIIAEARLKNAFELLKEETYTVSEVAWKSGFGSATYFNKCFSDYYGFPPGEAAKRDLSALPMELNKETLKKNKPRFELKSILIGGLILIASLNVLLFVILVEPLNTKTEKLPKSIAVLPFINDSQDTTNAYFINGVMDGIITNLSKIEDLTVLPRSSVEQYRINSTKKINQIAGELDVSYVVDGSGQKIGDQLKVTVNLIEGNTNKIIFSESFNREWEDVFNVQSEIATLIANQIEAKITREENEWINAKPTKNISAYNLLLKAGPTKNIEAYNLVLKAGEIPTVENPETNMILVKEKERMIREAIRLDSTYSGAYVDLGWNLASQEKNYDTILHLANRALHFDVKNSQAYCLKGWIFLWHSEGKLSEAEEAFLLEKKYSNGLNGYYGLGQIYFQKGEYYKAIENFQKGLELVRNPEETNRYLNILCEILFSFGLNEEANLIAQKQIESLNDSTIYQNGLVYSALKNGDFKTAYYYSLKFKKWHWALHYECLFAKDYKGALKHLEEQNEIMIKNGNPIFTNFNTISIYLKNGMKEKADYQLKEALNNQMHIIELNGQDADKWDYLKLFGLYCAMGNNKLALENVNKAMNSKKRVFNLIDMTVLLYSPAFELIQDEPEFKEFVKTAEESLLKEQVKIKKLLQNNKKLLGLV